MALNVQDLYNQLECCEICPRNCGTNRFEEKGQYCGMGSKVEIASYGPHFGEEPEIVGLNSSGTIFLSGCSLLCNFCQNHDISHLRRGKKVTEIDLIGILLSLQAYGCSNINFVTPSHFAPQLIKGIKKAKANGLKIPIVYNSSGYDKVETLKYWEGSVDIYMPDLKFVSPEKSKLYANAPDYFEFASKALLEMKRQVGDLRTKNGAATSGLIIRHLVMPGNQSDTNEIIDFIAEEIGLDTYLNLMEQYRPAFKAGEYEEIKEPLTRNEYGEAVEYAISKGFSRPDYIYGKTENS